MLQPGKLAVTTSRKIDKTRREYARERAGRWGILFIERRDQSVRQVQASHDALIVFEDAGVRLTDADDDCAFHPGMAQQRIMRLERGEPDALVDIGAIEPGHRVVDATLGFGRDALVAATAVGPAGVVIGLEASPVLYAFVSEGLRHYLDATTPGPIRVEHADAITWLNAGDEVYDLVILDPMFARPKSADPGFDLLRRHAVGTPLTDELIDAAVRRARRVVVKVGGRAALADLTRRPETVTTTRSVTWARFAGRG